MELHHVHTQVKEKHFKHYVFEFIMLFLAVFMGFVAENLRERIIERSREKDFVHSFTGDLKKDIYELDSLIIKRIQRKVWLDSLTLLLSSPEIDKYGSQIYYYARYVPRPFVFFNNEGTLQQLKFSGNLRLIRNQAAADTIMAYDKQLRFIGWIRDREETLVQRIFNSLNILFDSHIFDEMNLYDIEFTRPPGNPQLKSKNKEAIENFIGDIHFLKTVNIGQIGWYRRQLEKAKSTLRFLQEEYDLK